MWDRNRQPDRQKAQNCWSTLLHQEPRPHDAVVFVSSHNRSLMDVDEPQIWMYTSKINSHCSACLINSAAKELLWAAGRDITSQKQSIFSMLCLSHRLMLIHASSYNPGRRFYAYRSYIKHGIIRGWERHELGLFCSSLNWLKLQHLNLWYFSTNSWINFIWI